MKLLVLGASNELGRHVVSMGARRGLDVTAHLDKKPSEPFPEGVVDIEGNLLEEGWLASLVSGHEAVINALGPFEALPVTPPLIAALKTAGLSRAIVLSTAGAGNSLQRASWPFKLRSRLGSRRKALLAFSQIEQAWMDSGLDWVAVRAPPFRPGRLTRKAQTVQKPRWRHSISKLDAAAYMLNLLELKDFSHRTPLIVGP